MAIDGVDRETQCPRRLPGLTHIVSGGPVCIHCGAITVRTRAERPDSTTCRARIGSYPCVRGQDDKCLFCSRRMPTIDDVVAPLRAKMLAEDAILPFSDFTPEQQRKLTFHRLLWRKYRRDETHRRRPTKRYRLPDER